MQRLIRVLAATDPALADHGNRTARLGREVALLMGLSRDCVNRIEAAGRYHDIGKLFVPREILDKPGPPTNREWVELRRHPRIGFELVRKRVPAAIAQIVLTHHERVDGQGYPGGMSRREIPIEARVLQVADAFDAITSVRPYQPALPVAYAVDELEKYSGTQFDSGAVEGIIELIEQRGWAEHAAPGKLADDVAV